MSTGSPPKRRWLDSAAWLRSRPAAVTPPVTAYTAAVTATPTARFTSSSSTDSDGMNPPSATSTGEHRKARPKRRLSAASNEQSSVSSIGPSRLTSTHNRYLTLHRSIHTVPYPVGPTHPVEPQVSVPFSPFTENLLERRQRLAGPTTSRRDRRVD